MVFGWSHTLLGATLIAIISIDALHVLCLVAALVGGLGW
jgi:hypothetical protein